MGELGVERWGGKAGGGYGAPDRRQRGGGGVCGRTMSRGQRSYCATRYTTCNIRVLL
eukprot:COSAG05_NODE_23763_length_256_cov_0.210191_1_plen_56_part_10